MALTFGLTMVGCSDGGSSDGGGTFILTGIPAEYNGKYAVFMGEIEDSDDMLIGAQSIDSSMRGGTAVKIQGGKVSLPMWKMTGGIEKYSGNDTVEAEFDIYDDAAVNSETDEPIYKHSFNSVTFKNGSAAKTWNEGKEGSLEGEDVDSNDSGITIGNWTYRANDDRANNGTSSITMTRGSGADSNKLTFSGILNDGYEYAFCNITITPNETELAKLKTAASISFKVKGDGAEYQLQLPTSDITDYSYYFTTFTASTTETTVTINISDLTGPGWGQSETTPFDQSKVSIVVIQTYSTDRDGGHFNLTISDFRLNNDD